MPRLPLCALSILGLAAVAFAAEKGAQSKPLPWSFKPLQKSEPPPTRQTAWPRGRIDQYLLVKMEEAQLSPAPQAPTPVLIRRLFFDVTGLPPTPEEMELWAEKLGAQPAREAVAQLVDSLLASPHYGERWGRYWLDMARYTDKVPDYLGTASSAWLYRDWVVRALNEDMPYDEFVTRQLAVDQLQGPPPEERHALGFLGLSPTYFKELQLPPEIIKTTVADEWEEHVDAIGRTFLGLTVACARCHDHKQDPITAQDYYGLAGVFASVRIREIPAMSEELWAPVAKAREAVAKLEKERDELKKKKPAPGDLKAQLQQFEAKIAGIKFSTPHYHVPLANGVDDAALHVVLADGGKGTKLDYQPGKARDLELMKRGNPNQTGEVVKRRFLTAFPAADGKPRELATGSGRLDLARAILEDARPLAARVIVNRVWRWHFGRGLVPTPSEFGAQGEAPTHPELLDDLAARFVAHHWSLKWLHREILLSAAWQQDSRAPQSERADPENRLYARTLRRRLDIEPWRDAMLSASGLLDRTLGGPSEALSSNANRRRTLYGTIYRDEIDPMLRINDFPEASTHSPSRQETSTPLQMLFALNSSFLQQQADTLAHRIQQGCPESLAGRIENAYRFAYQRLPTTKERQIAQRFFAARENDHRAWAEYAQALLASNEMLYVD